MCRGCKPSGCRKIDKCMKVICKRLEYVNLKIVSSCCGHGKYPPSIIVKSQNNTFDIISGIDIPRNRNFMKKDDEGIYYIPEIIE